MSPQKKYKTFHPHRDGSLNSDGMATSESESTFVLYRRGIELLEEADFEQATEPLELAASRAPEKSSVREALGRAYFRCGRFSAAVAEFEAVVDTRSTTSLTSASAGRWPRPARPSAPATTWRWPPTCARSAATTASTASCSAPDGTSG